jgi:ankyrin repeat protein
MHHPLQRLGLSLMLTLGVVAWHQQPAHVGSPSLPTHSLATQAISSRPLPISVARFIRPKQLDQHNQQLLKAIAQGDLKQVRVALDQGASPDAGDLSNGYALPLAARLGQAATVQMLIAQGATVDIANHQGHRALIEAILAGHGPIVQILLERGANPNQAAAGETPLGLAVSRGDIETIQRLLDYGADRQQPSQGKSLLKIAEERGDEEVVGLLRER